MAAAPTTGFDERMNHDPAVDTVPARPPVAGTESSPHPPNDRASTSRPAGGRRETGKVSELPPPMLPPQGPSTSGAPASSEPVTDAAAPRRENPLRSLLGESGDPDWERIRELAVLWYRPLTKPEGWIALGYLFVGMMASIGFFVGMLAFGSIVFGLLFIGVGFLLIGPFFKVVEWFASAERAMAGWVGVDIVSRPTKPTGRFGLKTVTDPERWRMFGFIAANVVIAPVLFSVGVFCYSLVLRVMASWGWTIFDFFPFNAIAGILMLAIAAVALGAAPRVVVWVAALKANITAWFLGPDRLAIAEERASELVTQRQDILDAVASERRRIERNLHDGVQQQLVAIGLDLGMAEQQLDRDPERARELVVQARQKVQGSIGELRQLGRGLHPAILEDRGIDAALSAVVSGAPIPISVQVDSDLDLDTDVSETVYFIANEAIANVLKHAQARVASVHVTRVAANVRVTVHDDGRGGADAAGGTGLAGIRARVNAVDGSMWVTSPSGGPTTVVAELPRHIDRSARRGVAHHG
jgi:signal transduction histidine kinase